MEMVPVFRFAGFVSVEREYIAEERDCLVTYHCVTYVQGNAAHRLTGGSVSVDPQSDRLIRIYKSSLTGRTPLPPPEVTGPDLAEDV
jgi:hypothetical protein